MTDSLGSMHTSKCTACHKEILAEQGYCANCGQKIGKKAMTIWSILTDTFSNYFSFERSGLATVYKIIRRPEFMVQNYYQGNKGYYASPGKLVIFAVILIALHLTFVNDKILQATFDIQGVNKEYAFFIFNFILFTLISQLTFVRLGFKIALHAISIIYLSAAFLIVLLLIGDLFYSFGVVIGSWYYLLYLMLVLFWNSIVFSKIKKWWIYILNFLLQVVFIFLFMVFLESIGALYD